MSTSARSKKQPRLSYKLCAQRLACSTPNAKATFHCKDCNCLQCSECNHKVHTHPNSLFHQPTHVSASNPKHNCSKRGCEFLADSTCVNCKKIYCCLCDYQFHSRKEKSYHLRHPYVPEEEEAKEEEEEKGGGEAPKEELEEEDQFFSLTNNSTMMMQPAPDIVLNTENSLSNTPVISSSDYPTSNIQNVSSFHLVDNNEVLMVSSEEEFRKKLGCESQTLMKVVSIFGNTGDGKSHTLNHAFFKGKEVFMTSASQESCTMGVWAAFDPVRRVLVLDTEGFLGQTQCENQRQRLLLKILAVSDVVIYRTRAARIFSDLYSFLGNSSRIFLEYFKEELESVARQHSVSNLSSLGPSVIIFHETQTTEPYKSDGIRRPEDILAESFKANKQNLDAFNNMEYVGIRTMEPPTDYKPFQACLDRHLANKLRMARPPDAVYQAIKSLNVTFSKDIKEQNFLGSSILDALFQCRQKCLSCKVQCSKNDNHKEEHSASTLCSYNYTYKNEVFLCKQCYDNEKYQVVDYKAWKNEDNTVLGTLNYLMAGSVLECPKCGPIYYSRSHWLGNKEPWEANVVQRETVHVWAEPLSEQPLPANTGRKVVETVGVICNTLNSAAEIPAQYITETMNAATRPKYWQPDEDIKMCNDCKSPLERSQIHHCRACGMGVCAKCSEEKRAIKNWVGPQRVCRSCNKPEINTEKVTDDTLIRECGSIVYTGASFFASLAKGTIGLVKDTAVEYCRPKHWAPDYLIKICCVCKIEVSLELRNIHHCRRCGEGVCDSCSQKREPVPEYHPPTELVRVCDNCATTST